MSLLKPSVKAGKANQPTVEEKKERERKKARRSEVGSHSSTTHISFPQLVVDTTTPGLYVHYNLPNATAGTPQPASLGRNLLSRETCPIAIFTSLLLRMNPKELRSLAAMVVHGTGKCTEGVLICFFGLCRAQRGKGRKVGVENMHLAKSKSVDVVATQLLFHKRRNSFPPLGFALAREAGTASMSALTLSRQGALLV